MKYLEATIQFELYLYTNIAVAVTIHYNFIKTEKKIK